MSQPTDGKLISLTFDNGPHPDATPDVLRTLSKHEVPAAFFFVGENLDSPSGQDLATQAHADGHRIGNHTYSHGTPFGALSRPDDAIREIERTQELIRSLSDPDRLFRPNGSGGGRLDQQLMSTTAYRYLAAKRYTCVLWNCVPGDWYDPEGWANRALADIERLDWPLIVIHDLPTGAMRHLEWLILAARDLGAAFTDQFPRDCVPLLRGKEQWDMSRLTTGS